jgi:hypothetical protein
MNKLLAFAAVGLIALGLVALTPTTADAHPPRFRLSIGYSSGGYYPSYGYSYAPRYHDVRPHWHNTYTPYGSYSWYGNGPHDYVPHSHSYTPFGKVGHSYHGWGYTESYTPRYYRYYSPW